MKPSLTMSIDMDFQLGQGRWQLSKAQRLRGWSHIISDFMSSVASNRFTADWSYGLVPCFTRSRRTTRGGKGSLIGATRTRSCEARDLSPCGVARSAVLNVPLLHELFVAIPRNEKDLNVEV